ncbi:MAG TPA: hypothetical protein VM639_17505 [Dongiaceae bacterium]|nr:hypothetical protein [Dongiaceae bacterium]
MSVMPTGDATGDVRETPATAQSGDSALKPGNLLVEISPTVFAESPESAAPIDAPVLDSHHQATIALNVSDVLDLGTESIAGFEALVINGEQGDSVHLSNDRGYAWSRAEAEAPDGYQVFQASMVDDAIHAHPVYVLIQDDLTVILQSS